jgi:hypothetical protein
MMLQDALELSQPLLLEVGRYTTAATSTELLSDPAFGSYHALLQLDCAAEQWQEPGSVEVAGTAVAVGCMSWAVQQGKVTSPGLPPYTPPPTGCVQHHYLQIDADDASRPARPSAAASNGCCCDLGGS